MFLLELVLVLVAQVDHRLHVDFVERGQDGVGGLRLQQALGDAGAQAAHRHPLFRTALARRDAGRRHLLQRRFGGRHRRGFRRSRGGQRIDDVALGTRPSLPVPATALADRLLSASILAAAGMATLAVAGAPLCAATETAGAGAAAAAGAAAGAALAPATASVSIMAMISPATTVAPSLLRICVITPAAGAGSSRTTLSVSMSIRFSSRATGSPTFLCHWQQGRFGDGFRQLRNFDFKYCHVTLRFGLFAR